MHSTVLPELGSGPVLEVQTEALGLSSQEVEQYITVPMENNLLDGVMDVWDVRSQSVPGLSTVDLYFEPGTTVLHARQLVEERLTNAFSLPNVAKPPQLIQPLSSSSRVLMIGLQSRGIDPLLLSYLARWVVKPRLSGVPGVANVAIFGQKDRQLQVQVNPSQLSARHDTLSQIIQTAGNAQLVSPLSYLEGSTPGTGGFLDGPNQRLEIRPVLPLGTPKDLASVPISGVPGRQPLGSVTDVIESHQPLIGDAITSHRGSSSLLLEVQMLPSASVLGVTHGVEQALQGLRPALPGVSVDTSFFRPAAYLNDAWHNVELALLIGAALALLALIAVSLDARAVAVGAVSVALALLIAALVLDWRGYTFNSLVLLGLLIASVIVVDDAVGATYGVLRRVRERDQADAPQPTRQVISELAVELRGTLGYATLIVLLLIAPVFFSKGLTATFLHPMALSAGLAALASMFVALTFTPAMALVAFERGQPRRHGATLAARIGAAYGQVMRAALRIPRGALACVLLLGLVGVIAYPFVRQPAAPTFKDRNLVVQWTGPTGAGLTEMDRITHRVVGDLRALPAVADVAASLGRAVSADQIVDANSGQIYVALRPSANYDSALGAVRAIVENTPGIRASVGTYESQVMAGVLAPASHDVTVRVYGESYGRLTRLAGRIQGQLSHIGGLGPSHVQLPTREANIEVSVDDAAALRAGVAPGDARRDASTLVSGLTVGNFFEDQAVFDVVVIGVPSVRSSVQSVRNLLVDTSGGGHVRLGNIARVRIAPDPIDIQHEALSRYVDVTAPVKSGSLDAARSAIQTRLHGMSFPLNYHSEVLGGTPDSPTSRVTFLSFALAAFVGVLLLLQAAFGSWRLAAMFLLALPASLVGALLVAVAIGQASALGTDAGLLAVFLFAVRQGMLQVVGIRRQHTLVGGRLSDDVVLRASAQRFAPSLASLLVTAAALLPFVAIGDVAGNEIAHTTASVILGGLLTATLLNLVLVPALCARFGPAMPRDVEEEREVAESSGVTASSPSTS